jgi:hypothetical protein
MIYDLNRIATEGSAQDLVLDQWRIFFFFCGFYLSLACYIIKC